jgi:hypothetical protein
MMYTRPVSPIPRGVRLDSVERSTPQHTLPEDPTRSELVAAIVWLASGYERAIDLADTVLRAPAITMALSPQDHAIARDAVAQQRVELTAVRLRVATLLDQSAHLRPASNCFRTAPLLPQ